MADALYIDFSGFGKMIQDLKGKEKEIVAGVDRVLDANTIAIASKAKRLAPVNFGGLHSSIGQNLTEPLKKHVTVNANYAAYVEFGTGSYAAQQVSKLPATWQEFALKYKGKTGGSFEGLLEAIYLWVKRKKIGATYEVKTRRRTKVGKQTAETTDRATAYYIAVMIILKGIHAHPFLYPAYEQQSDQIRKDIEAVLKAL